MADRIVQEMRPHFLRRSRCEVRVDQWIAAECMIPTGSASLWGIGPRRRTVVNCFDNVLMDGFWGHAEKRTGGIIGAMQPAATP
jgi:hypothetical protein